MFNVFIWLPESASSGRIFNAELALIGDTIGGDCKHKCVVAIFVAHDNIFPEGSDKAWLKTQTLLCQFISLQRKCKYKCTHPHPLVDCPLVDKQLLIGWKSRDQDLLHCPLMGGGGCVLKFQI